MPRLPLIPTLVVALAAAAMIGLGVWQLERRTEKLAQIARYTQNLTLPPVALPPMPVGHDELLYRHSSLFCLAVTGWEQQGGQSRSGTGGWLLIAHCRTGVEGPGLRVALGVARDPGYRPQWQGGEVRGVLAHAPNPTPLIARLFTKAQPTELMLVADAAPPGLETSVAPDPAAVPNNHLAYAVQWFLFAGLAVVIYLLALWRRGKQLEKKS